MSRRQSNPVFTCPEHGLTVQHKVRHIKEDDGTKRYGGEYFACPQIGKGCDYAVGLKTGKASGQTAKFYRENADKAELNRLVAEQREDARS